MFIHCVSNKKVYKQKIQTFNVEYIKCCITNILTLLDFKGCDRNNNLYNWYTMISVFVTYFITCFHGKSFTYLSNIYCYLDINNILEM